MKKFATYVVVAASLVYYAALPFVVAQADATPLSASSSGATTAAFTDPGLSLPVVTTLYMRVTAYASVPNETDDTPFITANGSHVYYGEAASNILPFGTKIEIPDLFGDKIFTIEDRMSTRIKNTIDIWMPTVTAAIRFGMSHANIVVITVPSSTKDLAEAN